MEWISRRYGSATLKRRLAVPLTLTVVAMSLPMITFATPAWATGPTISDFAGSYTACSSSPCGDTYAASSATLNSSTGLTVDSQGNVFVADSADNVVRMIPAKSNRYFNIAMTSGHIYTIAGNYTACTTTSCGTGVATSAELNDPSGLAVDSAGDVYIADAGDDAVRLVNEQSDDITTVVGEMGRACTLIPCGGVTSAALSTFLNDPSGVAWDQSTSSLYIADTGDDFVRVLHDGTVSYVAGWYDYLATVGSNSCLLSGSIACGDGGPALSTAAGFAALWHPTDVAVDSNGNLFIADQSDFSVRMIPASNGSHYGISGMVAGDIYLVAGVEGASCSGSCGSNGQLGSNVFFDNPDYITLDSPAVVGGDSDIFISDSTTSVVRMLAGSTRGAWNAGDIYTVAGQLQSPCSTPPSSTACGDGSVATSAYLKAPRQTGLDAAGDLFIVDSTDNVVSLSARLGPDF